MDVAQLSIQVDSRDVKSATSAMDSMGQMGDKLTGIIKGMAAAWASWKVIQYARDAATLAARYETLGVVMGVVGNNAGYTRRQMDDYAASLTKAGISMVESRNSLAVMAQSHINLAKAQQLGRLAQDAAVIGNMNSSEAFQHLIHGIQSGQTEILRTIGINVNFENSYKELAKTLHKSVADLTEYEKTQARTNVVLQKAPDLAGAYEASMQTAGKQLLSMTRYAEDLETVFGSLFSEAFGTVVQSLNQALQDTKKWLVDNAQAAETMRFALGSAATNFVGLVKDVLGVAASMSTLNDQLTIGEILTGGFALGMAGVRDIVAHMLGMFQMITGALSGLITGALYGITKLIGMIANFQPPAWMQKLYGDSFKRFSAGIDNVQKSAVGDFYTGGPAANLQAEFEKSLSAKTAALKAEQDRIKSGNDERAKATALAALTKAREEAAKASEAYAKMISGLNIELAKERINLEQGAVAAYKFGLMTQGVDIADREALAAKMSTNDVIKQTIELEKKLIEGRKKLVEINPAIAEGLWGERLKENADAMRYAAQLNMKDDYQTKLDRLNRAQATGTLEPAAYAKELHKLQLESKTVWGAIAYSVENFADRGADALASFFNGTKTGFREMVSSMLVDIERLILKEQVMGPLMKSITGSSWLAGAFGAGGGAVGGGSFDWSNPNSMPSMAVPGGGSVSAPIQVFVSTDGTVNTKGGDSSSVDMKKLGDVIGAKVREGIVEAQRPGGILNRGGVRK